MCGETGRWLTAARLTPLTAWLVAAKNVAPQLKTVSYPFRSTTVSGAGAACPLPAGALVGTVGTSAAGSFDELFTVPSIDTPTTGYRVLETVGVTYRQLDYRARTGLVTPSVQAAAGSGSQRLYSDPAQRRARRRA